MDLQGTVIAALTGVITALVAILMKLIDHQNTRAKEQNEVIKQFLRDKTKEQ